MGIYAELKIIAPKENCCADVLNVDEYVQAITWSLDGISEEEAKKASEFYKKCLADGKKPPLRDSRWALISWKKA